MIFGDSSDEGSSGSLKRGVPTNVALVYGKSTYELEFTDDDFASEERPEKGVTVLSLKFIASRILTPKILTNNTANNGASTAAAGAAGSGNKLINPSNFTLIHHGKKLLDDKKYLVDYKIKNGDKILVMVSNPERVAAAAAAATRVQRTEKKTASASKKSGSSKATSSNQIPRAFPVKPLTPGEEIQKILDQLDKEILPLIQKFISHPPESESARKEEHHRISELVLQKMFLMDGIDVSASQEVRQQRKDAINTMHKHLASIDTVHKPEDAEESVETDEEESEPAAADTKESEPAAEDAKQSEPAAVDAKDDSVPADDDKKQA